MSLFIGVTPITTKNGSVLGYLRDISPYQKAIFNRQGAMLGWWNPRLNKTFSANGKVVSNLGDLRANLLSKNH
jgi:hypothetical protein